jgi:hypothetical protein
MILRHIKRLLVLFIIGEVQIETTPRPFSPIRLAMIQNCDNTVLAWVWERQYTHTLPMGV